MAGSVVAKIVVGLTVLGGASVAVIAWDWNRNDALGAATDPVLEAARPGANGLSLEQEEVAVAAVQAHLRGARVERELSDIRLFPLSRADEIVVCGLMPSAGAEPMQIVARVVLNQAGMSARPSAAPSPQARRISSAIVIMEAGPGLGRGGAQQTEGLRHCRAPEPNANGTVAAHQAALPAQAEPEARDAPPRIVVVSPVRVRAAPAGSADILWTAPRGRSYVLLDRAPGGWVQIGVGEAALGWVHSSLLGPAP